MHLQRRRLELTNLDGVISASEHHRKKHQNRAYVRGFKSISRLLPTNSTRKTAHTCAVFSRPRPETRVPHDSTPASSDKSTGSRAPSASPSPSPRIPPSAESPVP